MLNFLKNEQEQKKATQNALKIKSKEIIELNECLWTNGKIKYFF